MLTCLCIIIVTQSFAQTSIKGHVYKDKYRTPLDSVYIYTSSGSSTVTNKLGEYSVNINGKKDSIWFAFHNKNTKKYPIDTIKNKGNFEIRIYLPKNIIVENQLPTVTVQSRSYIQDSLFLRNYYAKLFNWKKPTQALADGVGITPTGIGVDLDAVINLFRFGYNRRQEVYHKFALQIEQDRYIDHRFTKKLVLQLTGLDGKERDDYMRLYRPQYKALLLLNEIDLGRYIQLTYKKYLKYKTDQKIKNKLFHITE